MRKTTDEDNRERSEEEKQRNNYVNDSIPVAGVEWFEVVADYLRGLKSSKEATDDER